MEYLYIYFELFALVCCILSYKKLDKNFRIFLPFLIFIVIYEYANIRNWLIWKHTNTWCTNLESIVELLVYGWFIASLYKKKAQQQKVYITIGAVTIITLVDVFFVQGFWTMATIAMVIQNTVLALLVCVYYYNLLNNNNEHLDLLRYPPFYATIGLLFYSLTGFFYYAVFSYMVYKNNYQFYILGRVFVDLGCIFIYSLLAVSFLCFLRTKKLSSY